MKNFAIGSLTALACVTAAFSSAQAAVMLYEEQIAHEEEARIISSLTWRRSLTSSLRASFRLAR